MHSTPIFGQVLTIKPETTVTETTQSLQGFFPTGVNNFGTLIISQNTSTPFYSGNILDDGTLEINATNGAIIQLTGLNNAYSGQTIINAGTLQGITAPYSTFNLAVAGVTYDLGGNNQTIGGLTGVANSYINLGGNTLQINPLKGPTTTL